MSAIADDCLHIIRPNVVYPGEEESARVRQGKKGKGMSDNVPSDGTE
jgi:hypothetical protein